MDIKQEIKQRLKLRNLSQKDLSLMIGMPYQNLSSALSGKRNIPARYSIFMDRILGFEEGHIERKQSDELISREIIQNNRSPYQINKELILQKIKINGGLWSYNSIPEHMEDDEVIEEALLHLDFEDFHLLFNTWSQAHIKRVWKERLLSQGKRLNILNSLLAVLFFNQK